VVVRVGRRLFAAVLLIGLPLLSHGQQDQGLRDRDPDLDAAKKLAADLQDASFRRGPFYLLSRFRISDAGYTQGGFVPTGDQNGGLSLTLEAPHRMYFVPHKKVILSAEAVPGYSLFREGENGNQLNYLLRGDAHLLLNHLYLDVYASTADQLRAHVADINRLATAKEDEIGMAGELKYSSKTSALFSVRSRDLEYPDDRFQPDELPETQIPVEVLDRTERSVRGSFLHKTLPRTSFFAAGEVSEYDFPNKRAYDSRRTYYGGGAAYDAGRTQVRMEAGPVKLDFHDPLTPDYDGLSARIAASRSNGRWLYNLGADRDLGFSVFLNNAFFVSTSGSAGVNYVATRRLTLNARTFFERDEYQTPVFGRDRTDDISYTSVGFTYAIRRITVGADAGWYERSSTAFGDEAEGIRYALRLSFTP
jgi:hypothetical protein